jgi:hypothetical protein
VIAQSLFDAFLENVESNTLLGEKILAILEDTLIQAVSEEASDANKVIVFNKYCILFYTKLKILFLGQQGPRTWLVLERIPLETHHLQQDQVRQHFL